MTRNRLLLLALACCIALPALARTPADRPASTPIRASKVILVGDSTTAVQGGWGPRFCADHLVSFAACINLARGGRSTYNYRAEGSWAVVDAEMRTPGYVATWVLIQFGHNDQPGKPGRSTDLQREFPDNLRRYVAEVRTAGAIPVLVTPLTRRQFADGKLIDDLGPWADAVRGVARELDVPLVDLHARSRQLVQAMGPVLAMQLAQSPASQEQVAAALNGTTVDAAPASAAGSAAQRAVLEPMGQAKRAFDYTHLGDKGADVFATIVAEELARSVPALRPLLLP
ncbi:lysophospholipase L1-like esterase [Stenotrophomonas maltophilia]|uniref:rhamnogalacturonan acetylesterase n=1 Tax=Stenotrophomonas chelatiphaga TaxID=517011 RepID=UPI000F4AFF6A|nr:rhamnogalacturonan acetylesterase [Stenotrophomonas chelatiphaga]MCS4232268.1 lysophospholipase L1-like esterase [Stenotrophomonas chelatiphaga]ROQ41881.1 lysophospholipase L1-like esterase [Stenotrophomonas maltophilia]